ncbi:hypothetical protein CBR_g24109 [Chara braunii]|uniref:Major facilitator superfamily (MFS) profile domain-containing protein n=1 Tax=Chara braunii TaxID=69332 RepID=A0A388L5Z6_CHABU|nr:hypothetical protein CBR_g24109 [Chara braunii]|eukprot:GBG77662.1 hypothetical protein CBR_g24109 [Chara braunii]
MQTGLALILPSFPKTGTSNGGQRAMMNNRPAAAAAGPGPGTGTGTAATWPAAGRAAAPGTAAGGPGTAPWPSSPFRPLSRALCLFQDSSITSPNTRPAPVTVTKNPAIDSRRRLPPRPSIRTAVLGEYLHQTQSFRPWQRPEVLLIFGGSLLFAGGLIARHVARTFTLCPTVMLDKQRRQCVQEIEDCEESLEAGKRYREMSDLWKQNPTQPQLERVGMQLRYGLSGFMEVRVKLQPPKEVGCPMIPVLVCGGIPLRKLRIDPAVWGWHWEGNTELGLDKLNGTLLQKMKVGPNRAVTKIGARWHREVSEQPPPTEKELNRLWAQLELLPSQKLAWLLWLQSHLAIPTSTWLSEKGMMVNIACDWCQTAMAKRPSLSQRQEDVDSRRVEGEEEEEEEEEYGGGEYRDEEEGEEEEVPHTGAEEDGLHRSTAVDHQGEREQLLPPSSSSTSSSFPSPSPSPSLVASTSTMLMAVEGFMDEIGFGPFQLMLLMYAGMAWFADATEMILLSYLGPGARCEWGLTPAQESLITSCVFFGMLMGCYCWGVLADIKGRKLAFVATAVCTLVAGLLSAASPSYVWLLVTRGVTGFGIGGGGVVFSLVLEFAPVRGRGFWLVTISLAWTVGSILEALLAWMVMPSMSWRLLAVLSTPPLIFLCIFYPLLPESPRFLVISGRLEEARAVIQRVANVNGRKIDLSRVLIALSSSGSPSSAPPFSPPSSSNSSSSSLLSSAMAQPCHHTLDVSRDRHCTTPIPPRSSSTTPIPPRSSSTLTAPESAGKIMTTAAGKKMTTRTAMAATTMTRTKKTQKKVKGKEVKMGAAVPAPGSFAGGGRAFHQHNGLTPLSVVQTLFDRNLRRSTSLLWFVSFANAFTYYGLVLMATEFSSVSHCAPSNLGSIASSSWNMGLDRGGDWGRVLVSAAIPAGEVGHGRRRDLIASSSPDTSCSSDNRPVLHVSDYVSVLIACVAECPGLVVALAMVDWIGRKATMFYLLAACAVFTAPLLYIHSPMWVPVLLFGARGSVTGSFAVLWAYAPEVYPTAVRSTGIGLTNAMGRVGGLLCPFVAVALMRECHLRVAICLMVLVPALAAIACTFFAKETMGMHLDSGPGQGTEIAAHFPRLAAAVNFQPPRF